jgi:5-methylcytosine-specific restriction endonuclease McrA
MDYQKAWRAENSASQAEYYAAWRTKNADARNAKRREQYQTDPVFRERRILHSNGPHRSGDRDAAEYAALLRNDPCVYCGDACAQIDHIVPLVHGGATSWDNLTASCASCNASKCADPLLGFMTRKLLAAS